MSNKEKLLGIVVEDKNNTLKKIRWRKENQEWLRKSKAIAIRILTAIRDQGISQRELANRLDVSAQQVNKWVKGQENFKIDTISKIEKALGVVLIEVVNEPINVQYGFSVETSIKSAISLYTQEISIHETRMSNLTPQKYVGAKVLELCDWQSTKINKSRRKQSPDYCEAV